MPTNSRAVVQIKDFRNPNGTFKKGHYQTRGFIDFENRIRQCSKCKEKKSFDDFYPSKNPIGIRPSCKTCVGVVNSNRDHSAYYWKNKEKVQAFKRKHMYGLSNDDYETMLIEQNFRCKACGDETKLVVDHCHETGLIRGLLCRNCNTALGQLKDSTARV